MFFIRQRKLSQMYCYQKHAWEIISTVTFGRNYILEQGQISGLGPCLAQIF